jgi:FixJ family two-component response regulator
VPASSPLIVCLVDDDPSVRKSLTRLLDSAGFATHAFADAKAFLDHLATHHVPVAILDIWMERMTGMELLAHLCARSPDTRVIFITAHEDRAAKAIVMRAGAFDFFIKPFDPNCFLDAIGRAFAGAAALADRGGLPGRKAPGRRETEVQ